MRLGTIILIGFLTVLLARPLLYQRLVHGAAKLKQSRRAFLVDFGICLSAGLLINLYDGVVFGIILPNLGSMMVGCVIAGFFIGLDASLAQERKVILQARAEDLGALPSQRLFPMTRKFTLVAMTTALFVALVLILVFIRDVDWLTRTAQDEQSIRAAQLSVSSEISFIITVLLILVVNLIVSYSRNLRLLFDNETRVLVQVRQGDLSTKVPVATSDEFGLIAEHTNHMIDGLRHRFQLLSSLKLAEEVQQNLLPDRSPSVDGLEISGTSLYCDQTGGDYYDYFPLPGDKIGVVVADVCGHGIGSAMLMTSVRAFLTSAIRRYRGPAQLLDEINGHISHDCEKSGRFTTMFFLEIDPRSGALRWVRAGHEPAVLMPADSGVCTALAGPGLVLGVDSNYVYEDNSGLFCRPNDIVVIGTDGIRETRNRAGELFGTERLEKVVREQAAASARTIQQRLVEAVAAFRGELAQEDDLTLVVIKAV